MSTTIDERVVSMEFDNKHFERNVQTSLSTLDKLKQSLNLSGASKGLENIDAASKRVNMSGLSSAVETVRAKFSALEVMGISALANITNSAVNAGKRLVSAFTIDPVKTGLAEYETQINAVQTILANTQSKGTTLKDVNGALDELNTYADKTIYNFTEMTRNIGTFTAAGVDLDTSVSAIKGIANLAAVSGSNSQQASTAMYQLSQALASGTVKLQDWNSVVNAGMGGQVFQDALKETARVHGIAIDDMIESEGSFRETLQSGWLSSEILTETLSKFTGDLNAEQLKSMGYTEEQVEEILKLGQTANDAATKVKTFTQLMDTLKEAAQSGWTQTWEILIGDFEEAKELWTSVSDVFSGIITSSADARNKMLQGWADGGGREMAIDALKNTFEGLLSIITPIKEAFREIFPPMTSKQLLKITENIKNLTEKFKLSEEQSAKLKSTFKGLFSIIDIGVTFVKEVVSGFAKLLGNITGLGNGILDITGSWGDWVSGLRDSVEETNIFGEAVDKITGILQKAIDKIKEFVSYIKEKVAAPGYEGFLAVLIGIWEIVKKLGGALSKIGSAIGSVISTALRNGDIEKGLDTLNAGIFTAILLGIKKFVGGITDTFDGAKGILENVTKILDSVRRCFEAYQQNLKAGTLLKIAGAIAILAASIFVIAMIDPNKLTDSLSAITVLFAELIGSMAIFGKIGGVYKGAFKATSLMIGMSLAVLILASALKKLSDLDWDNLAKGITGIAGLTAILVGAAKLMSMGGNKIKTGAVQMVIMAAAIKILASVCKDLSELSWEELAKGLVGVGALMAEVSIFLNTAKFGGKAMSTATGMVILAAAMKILASVCSDFGAMSWGEIGKGLAAVGGLLTEITLFTNLTGNAKHVISTGIVLIGIAAAMKILASVIDDIGGMSWEGIAKGLTAMAGALLAITLSMNFMPKNMVTKAIGLIGVAAAITVLGNALTNMSGMSWAEIAKGLVALGGSMAILAIGLNAMKGTILASAALLVAAAAFAVFTPILKTLGEMSLGEIGKGLLALAGTFVVLGVASAILKPLIPTMYALSGAILLFGVGCAVAGAGILAVSVGLTSLSASAVVAASSIVAVIVEIVKGLGDIIIAVCDTITNSSTAIAESIVAVIEAVCYTVRESIPVITETILQLLVEVLSSLKTYTPQIVDLLVDVLVSLMDKLAERIPELVTSAVNLIGKFFDALDDALGKDGLRNLISSLESVAGIFIALGLTAKIVSTIPISGALTGIASLGIFVGGVAAILTALGGLAQIPGFEWIIGEGSRVLGKIGTAIGKFVGNIAGGILTGVTSGFPQIGKNLSDFITNAEPFINGVKNIDNSALDGVAALAKAVLAITAADVISGITSWVSGGSSFESFGKDLSIFAPYFKTYCDAVSGIDGAAVESSANAAMALTEFASNIPNSGGLVGKITGENSLSQFAEELAIFGPKLKKYADSVTGLDAGVVENSANAASALAAMAANLPNSGGLVGLITGENDLSTFAEELAVFGPKLKEYADSVSGLDAGVVENSVNAAKALSELATNLPNQGGVVSWFTGDNTLSAFGEELVAFGPKFKKYADDISGVDSEAITASANAALALSKLAENIPNSGGIVAWFAGDNSIAKFGSELGELGKGLKNFSDEVTGIDVEAVTAAANAGKVLADMASIVPNEGGIAAWFAGENSLASFSEGITEFGSAMKTFSSKVTGIDIEAVTAAANAGKVLAEMTSVIPNEGGLAAWFAGENSLASFSEGIINFGSAIKTFSSKVTGIDVEAVTAASNAGKTLADMASIIPNEGGVSAWFAGENSLASFSEGIITFGGAMKKFSSSVAGIDVNAVTAASNAGKVLAEMTNTIPNQGGIAAWFSGEKSLAKFGDKIASFGSAMKQYSDNVSGVDIDSIKAASNAGKTLAEISSNLPDETNLSNFGDEISLFGYSMRDFASEVSDINDSGLLSTISSFSDSIESLGKMSTISINKFIEAFSKGQKNARSSISNFIDGMKNAVGSEGKKIENTFVNIVKNSLSAIANYSYYSGFYSAGSYLVDGFAAGISANTWKAEAKAAAMANAAERAAKNALDEHSPSKKFYKIGVFAGIALVNALGDYESKSYTAGAAVANAATKGLSGAISKISDTINSDMDAQPTIRPVLDLSNIESGAGRINGMLDMNPSVGVLSNVRTISSMMNRNQNGSNDDVISAIKDLGRRIGNTSGDTYQINGITYDDGSNVSDAVRTLVRAARVERRK